jgi:hypothetical protein
MSPTYFQIQVLLKQNLVHVGSIIPLKSVSL